MIPAIVGGCLVVGGVCIGYFWYAKFVQPLSHIAQGSSRRALWPVEKPIGVGAAEAMAAKDVTIKRALFTLKSGEQIFYSLLEPVGQAPSHIVFWVHGYMANGDMHLENMLRFVRRGALVVIPDLPGHGHSDGLLYYTPDWWKFIDAIWEFADAVVEPARARLANPGKVFIGGVSLGGGISACLAIQRPKFFEGVILIAPMLFVAEEAKPPPMTQAIMEKVLAPGKLTWPVTPVNMDAGNFEHDRHEDAWTKAGPFPMYGLKPRLATAYSLGVVYPNWLEQNMAKLTTPFIVLHSKTDTITDPNMSATLHKDAGATDKTLLLYDNGARHVELFYCTPGHGKWIGEAWTAAQTERTERCFKDILAWMDTRVDNLDTRV